MLYYLQREIKREEQMNNPYAGANQDAVKDMNYSAVLKKIVGQRGISRIEIASSTEMSCAFVTKVLNKLTVENVVTETKNIVKERGRPKVSLSFNYERYAMLGLRINREYISAATCTADGNITATFSSKLDENGNTNLIYPKCIELLKLALEQLQNKTVLGIGIAAPGPLAANNTKIASCNGTLGGLSDISITERIEKDMGLKTVMWHDAHCGAFNEYIFSNEPWRYRNIVFIASDSGIGAGIIIDGKPYDGCGMAGEISNMLFSDNGKIYNFGQFASSAQMLKDANCKSVEELTEKVKNGVLEAEVAFDDFVRKLAIIAANFIVTISPQVIVISDKIALLGDRVENICNAFFNMYLPQNCRNSVSLTVRPYSKHSVLRGACGAVLHRALEEPCKYFNL